MADFNTGTVDAISYALAKQVPSMERGFTISTSYGDIVFDCDEAPQVVAAVRRLLEAKLAAVSTPAAQSAAPIGYAQGYEDAIETAAFYVLDHCTDGETHADAVRTMTRPEAAQSAGQEAVAWRSWCDDDGYGYWDTKEEAQAASAFDFEPEALGVIVATVNGGEHETVEVAVALEQQRTLAIVKAVRDQHFGTSNPDLPTQASAAFDLACEEIEHRLRTEQWTLDGVPAPLPVSERAALSADGGEAVDLEGLRAKLLDGRPVIRDAEGWYDHPAMPFADEDVNYEWLLAALGIETRFVSMEADDSDAYDRYGAAHEPDCHYWTPTVPDGDGWQLLSIYDTEDGPHVLFGRDIYAVAQARRKEHTRRLAAAIAAKTAKGDA
ncbi:hypothetical protein [Pandoraea anhela]|uniref:Uncharacterized protein n=1 Tax=Pandoraea anhela TaxID=2508295 RepID=A0A5E4S5B7_9BURK|nr:hypothetical protein [Pandoraea anhela]VVD70780.1 hypothetical protein PAN31108_00615 [Pandoraea anhela]